jgi:translation initiation factor IF-1
MPHNPALERTGTVVESLPNIMFRVKLDEPAGSESVSQTDSEPLLAYLSGKMRLHRIRVLVGDRVILELEPYGGKARIIKRL